MDNVGIVVEDLDAAVEFFIELGLELEGRAPVAGEWADRVSGVPKAFSLGSPNNSGSRLLGRTR